MTEESKPEGFLPLRSDGTIAPGTLACTTAGGLIILVEAERHRIAPEDVKALIFAGRRRSRGSGCGAGTVLSRAR